MELTKHQLQNKGSEPPVLTEPNGPSPTSAEVVLSWSTPDVLIKNEDDDDIERVKYFSKEITKETKKELQNALSQKDELKEVLPQVLSVQVRELVEPILDGLVEQIEPALLYGMEFPDECESEIESQSEDEKDKNPSTIWRNEEALEVTKVTRRIFSEKIEQTSITEQQLFFYYDSSMKEALEVVKVMRQKLSERIEQMSEEERLLCVYSIHSLGTALIQYSPELLEHSPEVAELAALLLQMGQFHQFLSEKRNSTTFRSIVHALSLSLAEGQIPLVSNPHVKEAIQIMSKRAFQNMDQLTEYFGFKTLFSSKKLFTSMLVEERTDGHKSSYKYNEVAFLFNAISDSDSDSNSTILPLPQDSCEKEVAGSQELFKKVDGKMVRNVHQTENYPSSPTPLLVLPWKGAENHTPINPVLSNKKHLNSKEISDSKQKSKFKYVLPEKASPWKYNKPESISSCCLHADQNVVQHAAIASAIASAIAVHSLRVYQPRIYQTGNRSSAMLPIVRSDLCAFHPSPPPDHGISWCWKRRLNSIDHKNKVNYAQKISISQLEVLDTECRETICHAVVSECTPEEASLLICVLHSRELNIFSQCDKYGNTPLHVAVLNNNKKAVEKLLEIYPTGVWIVNQDGETPVDLAYRMHHIQIILCLLEQSIKDDPHSPETSQLWLSLLSRAKIDGWNVLQNILLELQVQLSQAIDPISNDMQTQTVVARVAAVSNNSHCNNLKNKQMEQDQRVVSANNNDAQETHETSLPAHPVLHEDLTEYNNDQLKSAFLNDTDGNELHTSSLQDNVAIKQPHNSNNSTQPIATNTFTSQNLPHSSEFQHEPPNMPKPKVIEALQLLPTFSKDPNPETQSLQHLQHDLLNHLFPSDEGSGYSEDDQHDDTKIKRRYSHSIRNRRKSRQTKFAFRSVGSGSSSCACSSNDKNKIPNSQKQKNRRKVAMERIQRGRMSASDSEYKGRKVKRRTRQHKTVTRIETTPASSTDSSTRFKSLIQQSCGNCRKEKSMPEIVKAKEGLLSPSSIEIHSNETYSRETNSSETPFSASDSSHLYAHPTECNADSIPQGEKKSKLLLPSLPDSSHLKDKIEKLQTEEHEHIDVSVTTPRDISQSKSPTSAAHTSVFSSLKVQPLQSMSMQSEDGIWKCSGQTMIKSPKDIVSFPCHTCCLTMLRGYPMTTEKELDQKEIYSDEFSSDSHLNFELIKQHSFAPLCITGLQKPCLKMWDGNVRISKLNITVNDLKWFQSLMKAALLSSIKHFCLPVTLTCSSNAYTHAVNDNQQLQEINPKKESEGQHLQFGNQVVSDLQVCLKTTLPCASYDKIFHCLSHYFANSTLSPTNRAKLADVCGNNMPTNSCDNLSNIKVVQLQPPHTFCMLEQHKLALTTYSGDMRFLPKEQKKRFELLLGYALCLQLMMQAAQNFVSSLSVHWTKALNVNISTPEAVQVNPIIADDLEKALVQKQSSSSNFEAALTAIIHDTDYNKIKELIPKSLYFLFGFSPWSGQHLSKFHERRYRVILKVARCNRSAIPADVKPNLDGLAKVFRQRQEQRPGVKHQLYRGGGGDKKSQLALKKSSKQLKNTHKDGVVSHGVDPGPPAEIVGGNLTNLKLENRTANQPSIQPLSSSNRPSILPLSSNIQHDKWMHLLSDSQRQFHEERITIIAKLIHAQDYPRILPLSYWGNPPTNLPPKYLIAYIFSTAMSYYKMGNNKESLVHFQASLDQAEVFERKGDVTLSCVYIGDIEFSQRKFIEAAKHYQTALKNYSCDSVARVFCMVLPSQSALCAKHGSALKNATKVVDAINAYELAIAKAESKKDKLSAHTSLGNLLQSLGENSRAITEYETSIELATALGDFVALGSAYGNMGNAFLGLYQGERALHHLEKSLDLTVEHEPIPQAIGQAYNNLGNAHQALNELDKAEEFYDLALGQAIYGNDIPGQARVYGNIGNLLMLKKECDRAVPHYTEVLRLSQDRSTVSTAHHNRGCAYYEWAETKKETFLNEDKDVMPTIKPLLHGPQFEHWEREYSPPFIPENIKKYYTQATKDLDYVIRYHEESLDSIKGSAKGLSLSVSLFESNSRTFHRKQDCLVSTGKFEEALLAAEQSRARTLGELLLKRRGPQLEHQLRSPPSLEQLKLTVALQNSPVVYLSYTGARLLGWLFYPTPSQPSLNMFEVPLSDDEFDGKSFDYHLRYSLNEVLVEKSFEMYTPFKFELSQNDLVRKLYDLVAQPLMVMLQKLKKDAESQETPQKKTQKIIVIPDSYTNLLPLTCLLNKDGKFWGDDHYFQIMPSLLTMGILDQLPTVSVTVPVDNQQMLCVVGNPTIPTFTYNNEEWNLGKLPHATREAEWVSHILNCTPILHEQATKTAVMMRIMNAKVIHLATHGSASAGFLAFAGMTTSFSGPMESKNVLIYPEEIMKLNITPALVVLSNCDSGRGIVKADGIQGMARAFILAGAQVVLTTLWKVPDESACIFMQFFYQYLVDGLKGTEALHKSILSVRCFSKYSQYIHWSGYQLTGREIQFSINKPSSAAGLTGRLGNHSIFPQLEIVKQLETTFLKNPRLPTDVQVLRGSSGVKPSEPLIDFIHSHHHHFRGGIFWINCKSTQLVDASVDYILKGMGIKDFSDVSDREGESTLVVFDFADKVPLQGSPISELLKKHNVHIVIISKHYFQSKSLLKDINHSLLRGTNVIDIQPLSSVHTTQRIVHSVLKYHHLASSFDEQQVFADLADFTTGSPAIIDVVSSLLNSHLEGTPHCTTEAALQGFVKLVQLKELGSSEKPQSKVRTASPQTSHEQSMTPIREISKSMHDSIKTVQESENPWVTNTRYDSWQVITTLIEKCDLSTEEQLLLFCLSNFNCGPIPTFFVTEMATMISKASHKSHLASSLHCRLENMKLMKPYPKPIVFHPSLARPPSMPATMNTDFVYVPQFIAEAMWKDMMSDLDKAMVFSIIFKSFQNISRQSLSSIEQSFLLGLCSVFVESCKQNYELVGKECFQEVYKFFLTLY